jgi:hypothetical protein
MPMISIGTMFVACMINRVVLHEILSIMSFTILRIRGMEKLRFWRGRRKQDSLGSFWRKTGA